MGRGREEEGPVLSLTNCCCCLPLPVATRLIGAALLLFTLGLYVAYLVKLEDFRDLVLADLYGISPCTIPPIDTLTDVAFQYSVLANLLLVAGCVGCTRWLLIPWMAVYAGNALLLVATALGMFTLPVPLVHENLRNTAGYQLLRCLGLIPLVLAVLVVYLWLVVRSQFLKMGKEDGEEKEPCCPLRLRTGAQLIGTVLAIVSGVLLVVFFAKLDELISRKYQRTFEEEISRGRLTSMAGVIVLAIMVNILVILGGSGGRWRRALLLPWLLFYGAGIVCCLTLHLYFTSLCWREEKFIGMLCLGLAFVFLILWSVIWLVAAEVTDRPKTLISRPSPLTFQRL